MSAHRPTVRSCADTEAPTTRRQWVAVVVAVVGIVGIVGLWSLGTARYGGPDEPAHVLRSAAVADGDLLGRRTDALAPGFRVVEVPAPLATGDPICFRRDPTLPAGCAAARAGPGTINAGTAAGIYPPWYYAMVGGLPRLAGQTASTEWYRVAAVGVNAAVLALVAWRAAHLGRRSLLIAAGVPPSAWFLFGVVNPNGLEVALALLSWVGVARSRGSVADLLWVSVPAALAVVVRPVGLVAAAASIGVALVLTRRLTLGKAVALTGPLALAVAATAAWNRWAGVQFDDPRAAESASFRSALWRAVKDVPTTLREAGAALSWAEYEVPWPGQVLWWAAAATLLVLAVRTIPRAVAVWAAVLVAAPIAFEVLYADRVGFIWQGRYSVATLVGLGALASVSAHRTTVRSCADTERVCVLCAAGASAIGLWAVVRRYSVGADGSWWFTGDHGWDPPVAPLLLVLANVVLLAEVSRRSIRTRR